MEKTNINTNLENQNRSLETWEIENCQKSKISKVSRIVLFT